MDTIKNILNLKLFKAINGGLFRLVKFLINKGANVNFKDKDGNTALIKIIDKGNSDAL